jgi:hypothetical protein
MSFRPLRLLCVAASVPDQEPEAPLPDEAVVVRGGTMEPGRTAEKAEDQFNDTGVYGLSVWSAAGMSAIEIAWLARSYDDPDADPPIKFLPHKQMRTSTVARLEDRSFALAPRSPYGHYLLTLPAPPSDDDHAALQEAFRPPEPNPARQDS